MKRKNKAKITVSVFVAMILLLSVLTIAMPKAKMSENENRVLQTFPEISIDTIVSGEFGEELEVYLSDHFFSRDWWITLKTFSERLIGKKDVNGVYFAEDDYLIERHKESEFDEKQVEKNLSSLEKFLNENQNLNLNVLIAPTTSYVMSDKLPAFSVGFDEQAFLDEVKSIVGEAYVDVSEILKSHADEYVYYRTDHHWTTHGAQLAYNEFAKKNAITQNNDTLEKASDDFLGTVYSKVNYAFTKTDDIYFWNTDNKVSVEYNLDGKIFDTLYDEKALEIKDKYTFFIKGNNPITKIKTDVENDKKILVIKDSFSHCFVPFLTDSYSEIIVIDYRYNNMSTKELIASEGVTDVLVLYNSATFMNDTNVIKLGL